MAFLAILTAIYETIVTANNITNILKSCAQSKLKSSFIKAIVKVAMNPIEVTGLKAHNEDSICQMRNKKIYTKIGPAIRVNTIILKVLSSIILYGDESIFKFSKSVHF